jgi:hypothetical protein
MLGTEPYICGNVGSGSPQEMMNWVEYLTSDGESPMANLRRQNGRAEPWRLKYFGVGNESWGCGGNMRPEYYADEYRRYNTFVKNYGGNKIYRIACGANDADYNWTEVLMERAGRHMNGLSVHYYTVPTGNWSKKGSATEFDEAAYHDTLRRTLLMEERIAKHGRGDGQHDPEKKIGMVIDEWGHLDRRGAGHEPRLPVSAEQPARCDPGRAELPHLPRPRGPRDDDQHRADRERSPGDDPDRRREDGPDADLPRLRDVQRHQGATVLATELSASEYTVVRDTIPCRDGVRVSRRKRHGSADSGEHRPQ